jgi:acetyl esterase/lipase
VHVGTRELCYPDVLRLQERDATDGVKLQATVCDGAVHVYPPVPAPEGRAAARTIVQEMAR